MSRLVPNARAAAVGAVPIGGLSSRRPAPMPVAFTSDRTICGLRVRSEIPMPETLPWQGDPDRPVDVHVRRGTVPDTLPGAVHTERAASVAPDGTYLFGTGRIGRYLVSGGKEIVVDTVQPLDLPDLRLFVLTNCLAALLLQRGLVSMHGSAVRIGSRTIAIMGGSGQGKSTLAAILASRGHCFMAEDVCALDVDRSTSRTPVLVPAFPAIRLWAQALEAMGIDKSQLVKSRRHLEKYFLTRPDWYHAEPEPLSAIVVLKRANPAARPPGPEAMKGAEAVASVTDWVLRPAVAEALGLERRIVEMAMSFAARRRVFSLRVEGTTDRLFEAAREIEELCATLPGD